MKVSVDVRERFTDMSKAIDRNLTENLKDVVLDVKRVSSQSAPHKTGKLEKNYHRYSKRGDTLTGEIYFNATNKGFDYAEWTHNGNYELGERSLRKRGGSSKFISGTVPVGAGYLSNTVERGADGYLKHLTDGFNDAIK